LRLVVTRTVFYGKLLTNILLEVLKKIIDHNILLHRSGLQPSQFLSTVRQDGGQARK